jgi:hypothetical protein
LFYIFEKLPNKTLFWWQQKIFEKQNKLKVVFGKMMNIFWAPKSSNKILYNFKSIILKK